MAKLEHALLVGGEGVVFDLNHLDGQPRQNAGEGVEHVTHGLTAKAPAPRRLGAAERASPRTAARGHQYVRIEVIVRRSEGVEVGDRIAMAAELDLAVFAEGGAGNALGGLPRFEPRQQLEKCRLALA